MPELLECSFFDLTPAIDAAAGEAPSSIVFMPKGRHTIHATQAGKSVTRTVHVTEAAAAIFQRELEATQGSGKYLDFDHKRGRAAGYPKAFRWDDDKGVILDVDWSSSGKAAVAGRDYRYVSPTFHLNGDKPSGLGNKSIGGLVSQPAFQNIPAIAAKDNDDTIDMKDALMPLVEGGIITAAQAEADSVGTTLLAKFKALVDKKDAVDAMLAKEVERRKKVEGDLLDAKKAAVKAEIDPLIEAKAIVEEDREFYETMLVETPDRARRLFKTLTDAKAAEVPDTVIAGKKGAGSSSSAPVDASGGGFNTLAELEAHIDAKVADGTYKTLTEAMQAHSEEYGELIEAPVE